MKCLKCDAENKEGTIFCCKCGERLSGKSQETKAAEKRDFMASNFTPDNNATQPQINVNTQENKEDNKNNNTKIQTKGVVRQAFSEIKSQKDWFAKTVVLSLINMVPILNFGVVGYIVNWAKNASSKDGVNFPKNSMKQTNFIVGLQEILTFIAYTIIISVACFIINNMFGQIPVLGVLISLALIVFCIFWNSYTSLSVMRGILLKDFGEGFNTKEIVNKFKKNTSSLFCAYFVPSIICGAIMIAIIGIILALCIGILFASLSSNIMALSNAAMSFNVGSLLSIILNMTTQLLTVAGPSLLVMYFFFSLLSTIEKLIRYRAVQLWIEKYASDWIK